MFLSCEQQPSCSSFKSSCTCSDIHFWQYPDCSRQPGHTHCLVQLTKGARTYALLPHPTTARAATPKIRSDKCGHVSHLPCCQLRALTLNSHDTGTAAHAHSRERTTEPKPPQWWHTREPGDLWCSQHTVTAPGSKTVQTNKLSRRDDTQSTLMSSICICPSILSSAPIPSSYIHMTFPQPFRLKWNIEKWHVPEIETTPNCEAARRSRGGTTSRASLSRCSPRPRTHRLRTSRRMAKCLTEGGGGRGP